MNVAGRWHGGHSLAAGVLFGLVLSSHVWTVALLAFVLGVTVGLLWRLLHAGAARLVRPRARREEDVSAPYDFELDYRTRTPW